MVTGGGGGWGAAGDRHAGLIASDLRDGYIDAARALRDYGFSESSARANGRR
jgi:N-methylhydantoinase B/oxoprolinase/acetone carboxylase alpha subunit